MVKVPTTIIYSHFDGKQMAVKIGLENLWRCNISVLFFNVVNTDVANLKGISSKKGTLSTQA